MIQIIESLFHNFIPLASMVLLFVSIFVIFWFGQQCKISSSQDSKATQKGLPHASEIELSLFLWTNNPLHKQAASWLLCYSEGSCPQIPHILPSENVTTKFNILMTSKTPQRLFSLYVAVPSPPFCFSLGQRLFTTSSLSLGLILH